MLDDPKKMAAALRHPTERLPDLLAGRHSVRPLLLRVVLPLCAIRPLALVLRGVWSHAVPTALVLAVTSLMLQLSVYVALALLLPWVMRPFAVYLRKRKALAISAVMGAPLWLSGVLYLIPEEHSAVFGATRLAVFVFAAYGVILLWLALPVLDVPPRARRPVILVAGASFLVLYLGLYALFGLAASAAIWLLDLGGG